MDPINLKIIEETGFACLICREAVDLDRDGFCIDPVTGLIVGAAHNKCVEKRQPKQTN